MNSHFVTLTLRTANSGAAIINALKAAGVEVKCCKIGNTSDIRIMVPEDEVQDAIRIMESVPERIWTKTEMKITGTGTSLLVPVDFSPSSMLAAEVAFSLARTAALTPTFLHAYMVPSIKDTFLGPEDASSSGELDNLQLKVSLRRDAQKEMLAFCEKIKERIKNKELPDIEFTADTQQGVPEEVIIETCRETKPALVVMVTRSVSKREEELVGSVTAEVADSCRVPLLAIPDTYKSTQLNYMDSILFLSNLNQNDFHSMEVFQKFFSYPKANIYIMPVVDTRSISSIEADTIITFFKTTYSASQFFLLKHPSAKWPQNVEQMTDPLSLKLIIVADKKRNIFARIFKPSIPHRILFERDVPMLVVPV